MKKALLILIILFIIDVGAIGAILLLPRKEDETAAVAAEETEAVVPTQEIKTVAGEDSEAPVITGVHNFTVTEGSAVSYKEGIEVTDNSDPSPKLTVDTSAVNLSKLGDYEIIYIATDASGNETRITAEVNVISRVSVSLELANAAADEVLSAIITEDMSEREKLEEVWWYLHRIGYNDVDYGEVDDYLDNAYYYLTTYMGNCRCCYAATKLIMERLGYKTMKVQNIEEANTPHYWNLVSADGGETWYHFDPTCWNWNDKDETDDDIICMSTDEHVWDYSDRHDYWCYNWDPSLYPATPTEPYFDSY